MKSSCFIMFTYMNNRCDILYTYKRYGLTSHIYPQYTLFFWGGAPSSQTIRLHLSKLINLSLGKPEV